MYAFGRGCWLFRGSRCFSWDVGILIPRHLRIITDYTCNRRNSNFGTFKLPLYLQTYWSLSWGKWDNQVNRSPSANMCCSTHTDVCIWKRKSALFCCSSSHKCQDNLNLSIKNVGPYLRVISNKGKYTESFQVHANHLM